MKAYGYFKNNKTIIFFHNQGDFFDVGKVVSFPRPKLIAEPTNDVVKNKKSCLELQTNIRDRKKNVEGCQCQYRKNECIFLVEYMPTAIKISVGNVFNVLGAILCYKNVSRVVYIDNNLSNFLIILMLNSN